MAPYPSIGEPGTMTRKAKPALRDGYYRDRDRRTIVDDRSGIVIDILQSGPDERPATYIEVYSHASGYDVTMMDATPKPDRFREGNPAVLFVRTIRPHDETEA